MTKFVDLGNGWIQYRCRICRGLPTSALKDSFCGRYLICGNCAREKPIKDVMTAGGVTAKELLERLPVIDDPLITEALKEANES